MFVRILTENKNYEDIIRLVSEYFSGATIIKAEGVSRGQQEHSLIIEVDVQNRSDAVDCHIERFIYALKKMNNQKEVLMQCISCDSEMV